MFSTRRHATLLLSFVVSSISGPAVQIADVTRKDRFAALVSARNDVWVVVFTTGEPGAYWSSAASKLQNIVRFGRVDCSRLGSGSGHADAPCNRARKNGSGKSYILGYTFTADGEIMVSAKAYVGKLMTDKVVKWALTLPPKLANQLTAHSGTNIFHKEELQSFLTRPRMAKAMFFTTSPKGDPPALVTALAVRFRQRLLIGEVKASDMALRNAFSVGSPPALIVTDSVGKRHKYKGAFKRPPIEEFLKSFGAVSPDAGLHKKDSPQTERVKVKKQAYSDADGERNYPKGFNPWRALGLPTSRSIPSSEDLKAAYKAAAKKWHPDKCRTNKKDCEARMAETSLANSVLSDNRRLQQWEAWREDGVLKRRKTSEL